MFIRPFVTRIYYIFSQLQINFQNHTCRSFQHLAHILYIVECFANNADSKELLIYIHRQFIVTNINAHSL
jgi:hypothetical protein